MPPAQPDNDVTPALPQLPKGMIGQSVFQTSTANDKLILDLCKQILASQKEMARDLAMLKLLLIEKNQ